MSDAFGFEKGIIRHPCVVAGAIAAALITIGNAVAAVVVLGGSGTRSIGTITNGTNNGTVTDGPNNGTITDGTINGTITDGTINGTDNVTITKTRIDGG